MQLTTWIKNLFFPSQTNGYKAYILRFSFLMPITMFLVGANTVYIFQTYQHNQIQGSQSNLTSEQIIYQTNIKRLEAGLPMLQTNPQLNQAAQAKANHMMQAGVFEHYYQDNGIEVDPWQFVLEAGYDYYHAGENLAKNFTDTETLVQAWMDSPTHRDNLLNTSYQDIGVAIVEGPYLDKEQTTLVVQMFGTTTTAILQQQSDPDFQNQAEINFAPLVEYDKSFVQNAIITYPNLLFSLTVLVTMVIGLSLIIDLSKPLPQQNKPKITIDLWRH